MSILAQASFEIQPAQPNYLEEKLETMRGNETVDLANLFIGDEGCASLAEFIAQNRNITEIKLDSNKIGHEGMAYLLPILQSESKISNISLQWNNLGLMDQGISILAEALSNNSTVTRLDLRNNQIGPEGGAVIGQMLRVNQTLETLDLRWNELGEIGGEAILSGIQGKRILKEILLSGNNIPQDTLFKINQKIQSAQFVSVSPEPSQIISPVHSPVHRGKLVEDVLTQQYNEEIETQCRLEDRLSQVKAQLDKRQAKTKEMELDIISDLEKEKAKRKAAETELARLRETNIHRQIHDSHAFDDLKRQIEETQKIILDSKLEIAEARENKSEREPWLTKNLQQIQQEYSDNKSERQINIDELKKSYISMKFTGTDELEKLQKSVAVQSEQLLKQYRDMKSQCDQAQNRNQDLHYQVLQARLENEMEHKLQTDSIWKEGATKFANTLKNRQATLEHIHEYREATWHRVRESHKATSVMQQKQHAVKMCLLAESQSLKVEISSMHQKVMDLQSNIEQKERELFVNESELNRVTYEKEEASRFLEKTTNLCRHKLEQHTYKTNKDTDVCQLRTSLLTKRNERLEQLVKLAQQKVVQVKWEHENLTGKLKTSIGQQILESCKEYEEFIDKELEL